MKSNIVKIFITTALALAVISCGKNVDGLTRVSQTLTGVVNLGAPMSGSTVTAYAFKKGERSDVLGTATTDENGEYKIEHNHPYRGPVLLVAANGSFVDPTTKTQMFMPEKLTLVSGIPDSNQKTKANINAATTIAAMWLEVPEKKEWVARYSGKDESLAVETVLTQLSGHFDRNASRFNYLTIDPWDPTKERLGPSESRVLLYLFHAGLSQMAKSLSKASGQEPGSIRMFDLIYALSLDAKDGILDGKQKQAQLYVDKGNQIPLDSYFLRHKLASSIQIYINGLKEAKVDVGFDGKSFAAPGGFYQAISMDSFPWMFAKDPEPIPFDETAPEIIMEYGGKYAGKMYMVLSREDVVIEASAVDTWVGIKSFKVLEPANFESTVIEKNKISVIIKTSMMPNAAQVIARCGYNPDRNFGLGIVEKPPTEPAACVCVEAKDFLDNTSYQVRCVSRPAPLAEIGYTLNNGKFGAEAFADINKIKIDGKIHGGWDLLSCGWKVVTLDGATEVGGVQLPWGRGFIENGSCTINDKLNKEQLPDGNYRLELTGEDLLGRDLEGEPRNLKSKPFEVYQTPPVIEITSPEAEIRTNASKIDLIGTIKSGIAIREVYVELVQGQWNESKPKRRYDGIVADGKWMLRIEELPEAIAHSYVVYAVDIYGNRNKLASRLIVVDRESPTIKGHRDGTQQGSYAQERSTVSVMRSGTPGMPQFQFKPNGAKTRIPWDNTPVLYRWANLVGDENTAPSYQVEVKDEGGVKEVRWAHGETCAQLDEATHIAQLTNGKAMLVLNSATSLDALGKAIDENKVRCISIWAVDLAGNTQNQQVSFRWRTVAPPIVVDFNSPLYDASQSEDDMAFVKNNVQSAYYLAEHSKHKDGYVVAHALLHNPHDIDLDFKMEDSSAPSIELKIKEMVLPGKDVVANDWVYHGSIKKDWVSVPLPGQTPPWEKPDWDDEVHSLRRPTEDVGDRNQMRPTPTMLVTTKVWDRLSNPRSHKNLQGSRTNCTFQQPLYSQICAPGEVILLGERTNIDSPACSHQKVECYPAGHRYGVLDNRDKSVLAVGEQVVTKQSSISKITQRYFSFDPVTKQVQEEIVADNNVLKIPSGKTVLMKWYLAERNIQVGLKNMPTELSSAKLVGECRKILQSKNDTETCDKAECKLDQVCFSLDGVQLRLTPKVSALKNGVGILSAAKQSPFKYSTQTESGAVSDEQVPVVLESPISRLVVTQ